MASKDGRISESERVTNLWFVAECAARHLPSDPSGTSEGRVRHNAEAQSAKPQAFRTGDGWLVCNLPQM